MVMGDTEFAVCVCICVSASLGRIFSETVERIWLKFCTRMEVCLGDCVSHFGGDRPRGPPGS